MKTQEMADTVYERRPAWAKGSISLSDARFLYDRALKSTAETVVEIGTASGVSTAVLCSAVAQRATEYSIATYDISPSFYGDRRRRAGSAAIEMLPAEQMAHVKLRNPATALDVGGDFPEDSLGFAFIDAAHKHPWPALDLLAVLPSLEPGAEVALHDINLPLINPDWQAWGVKYLFDELDLEKHVDPASETPNIGSIIVPGDKEELRAQVLASIEAHDFEVEVPEETLRHFQPT
ncbi:MAG TPA: class I SAM-dependent methyltransferase [Solirubrobacterales bacterium]|nr:class I SAM-dependent methyltransferase [Solirubrobacterales bacterium]